MLIIWPPGWPFLCLLCQIEVLIRCLGLPVVVTFEDLVTMTGVQSIVDLCSTFHDDFIADTIAMVLCSHGSGTTDHSFAQGYTAGLLLIALAGLIKSSFASECFADECRAAEY